LRLPSSCKTVFSWLAFVSGLLAGLFGLVIFGMEWAPFGDRSSGWFMAWLTIAGTGLTGLAFITGSIVALRNRRSAGLIFLLCMPVAAYLLADPTAGFLVWHPDGGGYWETPLPSTGIGLTALFFSPFLLFILARRQKKRAMSLFAIAASVAAIVFIRSRWTSVLLPRLAGWSALFLVFGLFWLETNQIGWAPLFSCRPRPIGRRAAAVVLTCLAILCVDVAVTLGFSAMRSSLFTPDCGRKALFVHSLSPGHAVFTARIILAGRSIETLGSELQMGGEASTPHRLQVGDWAIAAVQKRFWGVPWPRLVLLTNYIYWKGETYFIDGRRARGLLTQFLPIVEAGPCSRSKPLMDADLELRTLQEGPPANGARIIGYAESPKSYDGHLEPPKARPSLSGAHILLAGPLGTTVVTTDQNGVYEIDGVPPGDYTMKLDLPDTEDAPEQKVGMDEMIRSSIVEKDFSVVWNGTVEGNVRETTGRTARVSLQLQGPNGTDLAPFINPYADIGANGSFRINRIPPGQYTLVVNPFGPQHESPYASLYYPSATQPQDAGVFELAQGQHLKNMNYSVRRLDERKLRIRFTTADGKPVKDPWFWVIYDHNWSYYRNPLGAGGILKTDDDGNGEISVFGDDLRLWVFAEVFPANNLLSSPVELRGKNLPSHLDLKLNMSESQFKDVWRRITTAKNSEEKR
jgi:hypothetical protein